MGNTLHWREIGFAIEIKGLGDKIVKKYFAINLHSKRVRRSGYISREAVVRAYYSTAKNLMSYCVFWNGLIGFFFFFFFTSVNLL